MTLQTQTAIHELAEFVDRESGRRIEIEDTVERLKVSLEEMLKRRLLEHKSSQPEFGSTSNNSPRLRVSFRHLLAPQTTSEVDEEYSYEHEEKAYTSNSDIETNDDEDSDNVPFAEKTSSARRLLKTAPWMFLQPASKTPEASIHYALRRGLCAKLKPKDPIWGRALFITQELERVGYEPAELVRSLPYLINVHRLGDDVMAGMDVFKKVYILLAHIESFPELYYDDKA